jgi:hypothetical protein
VLETPIQDLIARVRASVPTVNIERLSVTHPGDDNNVWWLWIGSATRATDQRSVQVDTNADGDTPFVVEGDDGQRLKTTDVAEATAVVLRWL